MPVTEMPKGTRDPLKREPNRPAKKTESSSNTVERTETILTTIGLFVQTPLSLLGRGKIEFALDAVAIETYKRPVAVAIAEIASTVPAFGRALDKLAGAGPVSALIEALVPMVAQIAENHDRLPLQMRETLGVIPKDMLIEELQRRQDDEQRKAEAAVGDNGGSTV